MMHNAVKTVSGTLPRKKERECKKERKKTGTSKKGSVNYTSPYKSYGHQVALKAVEELLHDNTRQWRLQYGFPRRVSMMRLW